MKVSLLFALLVAVAVANWGGAYQSSRVPLARGRRNVINFACAVQDESGAPTITDKKFNYNFSGLPSWLKASGSSVSGNVPASATGSYPVKVSYETPSGKKAGSTTFLLSLDGQAPASAGNFNRIYYLEGGLMGTNPVAADAGNFVVFLPFLMAGSPAAGAAAGIAASPMGAVSGPATTTVSWGASVPSAAAPAGGQGAWWIPTASVALVGSTTGAVAPAASQQPQAQQPAGQQTVSQQPASSTAAPVSQPATVQPQALPAAPVLQQAASCARQQDALSTAQQSIAALANQLTSLKSDLDKAQGDLATATSRQNDLQGQLNTLSSNRPDGQIANVNS